MYLNQIVIYQWNIRQFVYQWTPKVANVSPKRFHPPLVGVLADLSLLTDGNEKTTVDNTITKPTQPLRPFGCLPFNFQQ
ncbi:MAG: hypothetical protein LBC20_15545 [Planctomycetaceae bacterium]|jgi:hypothetical protein|nr:hypothetical protein [Planctomycetaceae bacterium]